MARIANCTYPGPALARRRLHLLLLAAALALLALPAAAGAVTYRNDAPISIPDPGPGAPFPSTITTSLDPAIPQVVESVAVELRGLWHPDPDDIDVLLVGPTGKKVMLLSDAGGPNAITQPNRRFPDFTDASSVLVPDSGSFGSGAYKPTDYEPGEFGGGYSTRLNDFRGTTPHGAWKLYVSDDTDSAGAAVGAMDLGWDLTITTATPDEGEDPIDCEAGEPGCEDGEGGETPTVSGGSVSFSALTAAEGFLVKVKVKRSGSTVKGKLVKPKKKKRARRSVGTAVTEAAASAKRRRKKAFVYAKGKAKRVPKGTYSLFLRPTKKGKARLRKALERRRSVKLVARLTVDPPGKGKVARKSVKLKITR